MIKYITKARLPLYALCMATAFITIPHKNADARPVSYPGGVTFMTMNDSDMNSLHLHYSPTARYSLGYKLEYHRDADYTLQALQYNRLVKRWNGEDSQANFYIKSGAGFATGHSGPHDGETEEAAFTGIATDWETRRYFVSYENRLNYAGDIDRGFNQSARIGIAPYIGEYGDVHTWLMMQVSHDPKDEDQVRVTPLVRLFKAEGLVEAGIDNTGDMMFNFVYRY